RMCGRINYRNMDPVGFPGVGVQHVNEVRTVLLQSVDLPVGIHTWICLVCSDVIVNETFAIGPIPHRNDDIPFYSQRSWRRRGYLTRLNSIGPICVHLDAL